MQYTKKILVLACAAAFCGTAAAQGSVEVFGVIDLGILSESNLANPSLGFLPNQSDKGHVLEMKDGGLGQSYWGIKGNEDLGGGLKATFALQGNFQGTTGVSGGPNSAGTTSMFNQLANVGFAGNFGSVEFGRVVSPIYWAFASTDVRAGAYFGSSLTGLVALNSATGNFTGGNSNAVVGTIYNDNAVVYNSPEVNGFKGALEVTFGGVAGDTSASRQEAATLMYHNENWKFDALIYNGNDDGIKYSTNPNGTNTNRLVQAGGMYMNGPYSVSAGFFKGTNPANTGAGQNPASLGGAATSGDLNMVNFGLGYKVSTQLNLTSGYYRLNDEANSGNHATMYVLGADYFLSKSTRLYAEAANVKNVGSNMNMAPVYGTPVTAGSLNAAAAGSTSTAFMVGVRHNF
ncbi:MAG: porin [Burkholderiaceae bacterium]|nr:porin [Burkholderiaceae bacterium]